MKWTASQKDLLLALCEIAAPDRRLSERRREGAMRLVFRRSQTVAKRRRPLPQEVAAELRRWQERLTPEPVAN